MCHSRAPAQCRPPRGHSWQQAGRLQLSGLTTLFCARRALLQRQIRNLEAVLAQTAQHQGFPTSSPVRPGSQGQGPTEAPGLLDLLDRACAAGWSALMDAYQQPLGALSCLLEALVPPALLAWSGTQDPRRACQRSMLGAVGQPAACQRVDPHLQQAPCRVPTCCSSMPRCAGLSQQTAWPACRCVACQAGGAVQGLLARALGYGQRRPGAMAVTALHLSRVVTASPQALGSFSGALRTLLLYDQDDIVRPCAPASSTSGWAGGRLRGQLAAACLQGRRDIWLGGL